MFELVRVANRVLEEAIVTAETFAAIDDLFGRLGGDCLGIVKDEYEQTSDGDEKLMEELVNVFIEQRSNARERKDFVAADAVREKLENIGIVLEDKPGETIWRRK